LVLVARLRSRARLPWMDVIFDLGKTAVVRRRVGFLTLILVAAGCSDSGGARVAEPTTPAEAATATSTEASTPVPDPGPQAASTTATTTSPPIGAVAVLSRFEPPPTSGTFSSMLALAVGRVQLRGECLVLHVSGQRYGLVMPYGTSVIDNVVHFADGAQLALGRWEVVGGTGSGSDVADRRTCDDIDRHWITGHFSDCCRIAPDGFGAD